MFVSKVSTQFTARGALREARIMTPLAISIFAYGAVYGMLARQAGLAFGEAVGMSALVAAGSAQFVTLGLWQMPLPAFSLVLTTLIINLRHLLMGVALHPWLARR
jgi:predicted branched-subunit amino acid permease